MTRPTREPVDPKGLYQHALHFKEAAEHLQRSKNTGARDLRKPAVVLVAFACELLLKTLHLVSGKAQPPRGHDLAKLFAGLPKAVKSQIEQAWDQNSSTRDTIMGEIERQMAEIPALSGVRIPRDLRGSLEECKAAFESMRYLYEDPRSVIWHIDELPDILDEVILEIRPDWA
jgi:HEPN domain-containing protein